MKYISVNGPAYRGAKFPKFDPKKINESEFEDGLRCKEYYAALADDGMSGEVEWLAQEEDCFSNDLEAEILRAFKANGAKSGCNVSVKYGVRDHGLRHSTEICV